MTETKQKSTTTAKAPKTSANKKESLDTRLAKLRDGLIKEDKFPKSSKTGKATWYKRDIKAYSKNGVNCTLVITNPTDNKDSHIQLNIKDKNMRYGLFFDTELGLEAIADYFAEFKEKLMKYLTSIELANGVSTSSEKDIDIEM